MPKWKIDLKIPIMAIIMLLGYATMGIVDAANLRKDVDNLKLSVQEYNDIPERLARLEQKTDDIKESLNRIEGYIKQ